MGSGETGGSPKAGLQVVEREGSVEDASMDAVLLAVTFSLIMEMVPLATHFVL